MHELDELSHEGYIYWQEAIQHQGSRCQVAKEENKFLNKNDSKLIVMSYLRVMITKNQEILISSFFLPLQ